jgi:hypothetical protein
MRPLAPSGVISLALLLASALPVFAQAEPPVGVRAAGMGGAFTAVADDASAVFWNPAGLAGGSFFSVVLDRNTMDHDSATLIALGTPPLGLSYYRTATDAPGGRDSLVAHHAGVTVLQSLGGRLAVGATLKLVRGVVSSGAASVAGNKFDTDLGVMSTGALGRIGLSVRNLTEPSFDAPDGHRVTLERRVRAGIAINTGRKTMAAADVDLTRAETARGEWREAAIGLEANPLRKAWVRGGVRWNTADGPAAPVGAVGASIAVYGSTLADVQVSFGSDHGNRGWGAGLRFVF